MAEDAAPSARRIRALPEVLANQIAAGEVVERPAAVVKELVENSIDAGASEIRVDVEAGGVKLVRVRDDGAGMARDQLPLALARHATSKLASFDDLQCIATLGFRGEALPSIASVSRLTLTSRTRSSEHGYAVELAGSADCAEAVPAAHPPGTTVEVRDLFFNTPARRRFLRTERTEYLQIETTLRRIALACNAVRLSLYNGSRRVFDAPPAADDPLRRLRALLGRAFAEDAVPVEDEAGGLRIAGWMSVGSRAHDDVQYVSVNGRGVRDPVLRHAIRSAFSDLRADGRQPGYVLALHVPVDSVDVNVHPTKHELRFRDARGTHDFVVSALTSALARAGGESLAEPQSDYQHAYSATSVPLPRGGVRGHPLLFGAGVHGPASDTDRGGTGIRTSVAPPGRWLRKLAPGVLLTASSDGEHLVDVAAMARAVVTSVLSGAGPDEGRRAQPLLLPYAWRPPEALSGRLQASETELAGVGLELRRSALDEWMLLSVPRVLQPLAVRLLVAALEKWLAAEPRDGVLVSALAAAAAVAGADVERDGEERWLWLATAFADEPATWCVPADREHLLRVFQR